MLWSMMWSKRMELLLHQNALHLIDEDEEMSYSYTERSPKEKPESCLNLDY